MSCRGQSGTLVVFKLFERWRLMWRVMHALNFGFRFVAVFLQKKGVVLRDLRGVR
jgi:hypothetical protein